MAIQSNRLGVQTSPYLLQHKDNPVAWHPWDQEALDLARREDKPILLSIGYSACHWCHVMAHESFEDARTAALMNQLFVNIKVDREERPDLDDIYQTAHQLLTNRVGGWPLTLFLCPQTQLPFVAGTYFPKTSRGGQFSFQEVLARVSEFYRQQKTELDDLKALVKKSYAKLAHRDDTGEPQTLTPAPLEQSIELLLKQADPVNGGFGGAPKFPMPANLERLLVAARREGSAHAGEARRHLILSLNAIALGGIYDVIGGGFFRYATDANWSVPHFEKMLYDNGLLLGVYAAAWADTAEPSYEQAMRGVADWVLLQMRAPQGGFYSALDADSEGEEGGYYLWSIGAIKGLVTDAEYALLELFFNLTEPPNVSGRWHLHPVQSWPELVAASGLGEERARALFLSGREKLARARARRSLPGLDDKILCGWNGLMVRGLALAGRVLGDDDYLAAAQRAIDFVRGHLWAERRLFATWQQGEARFAGYLDDYVFIMDALLELLQARWRDEDYRFLIDLAEATLANFEDGEHGGFFFTAHDHEQLIHRSKPLHDNVTPSGNGIAAKVFGRLGHLAGEPRYLDCVERTLQSAWASINRQPDAHHNLLLALAEWHSAPPLVMLAGDDALTDWQRQIQRRSGDRVPCYRIPPASSLHPATASALPHNHGLVCVGQRCLAPQETLAGLLEQLSEEVKCL
ncbi:thioredoxin domain-containing protein [Exilibacterium tricleocarpae]|uniref:Thioredoxin domain-containing protein n=1 Tax=Exilibacterium tricleocarpae TaxID=2591008 RepID=A0A545STF7_9GAMM|nr:thioredoxin domain-containing protein [Exilibacterium tricleocarpae]TQV68253.1 thioredoxin domain-containing protein [Exilibacterium tricleocarpae]